MNTILSGANSQNDNEVLLSYYQNQWEVQIHNNSYTHPYSIPYAEWINVAWVRDGTTGSSKIYVNKSELFTIPDSSGNAGSLSIASGGLWLGLDQDSVGDGWNSNDQFYGSMKNVLFWGRSLSSEEVAAIPEPCTIFLLGLGGLMLRKRK